MWQKFALGLTLMKINDNYQSNKGIPLHKYESKLDEQKVNTNAINKQRTWQLNQSIDTVNFLHIHIKQKQKNEKLWKQKYGCYEPSDIKKFFKEIKNQFIKPKDTPVKSLNKLLIWIHFLHTNSSLGEFAKQWQINQQTVINYVIDVVLAILLTYKHDKGILGMPTEHQQHLMNKILINTNQEFVESLFYLDGTHKLTVGRNDRNKRSWKYKWKPAWSHLFVIDRIFGIITAVNTGNPAWKHDLTVLKESDFGVNFDNLINELYYCLGDNAYFSFKHKQFCAMPKKTSYLYKLLDKKFLYNHKKCRVEVEHFFARFFINQNLRLNRWTLKGKNSLKLLNCNLICAIILWNQTRIWKANRLI